MWMPAEHEKWNAKGEQDVISKFNFFIPQSRLHFELDRKGAGCALRCCLPPQTNTCHPSTVEEDHTGLLDRHQKRRPQTAPLSHWVTQQHSAFSTSRTHAFTHRHSSHCLNCCILLSSSVRWDTWSQGGICHSCPDLWSVQSPNPTGSIKPKAPLTEPPQCGICGNVHQCGVLLKLGWQQKSHTLRQQRGEVFKFLQFYWFVPSLSNCFGSK